jgi:serine/threonine-protein kinase
LVRGRWHLDEVLGIGGMAAVYAATHRNGKRVAVKILHPEFSHIEEARRRFVDEGYLANLVRHPGVVSIIDDDIDEDGAAFLVMDLLDGETLEAKISRKGKLDPVELLTVINELLDILAAAHESGIIHRDVKPNNIFVTKDGRVKLLDFGVARMAAPNRPRTTQFGSTVGTPAFMPPEQARGRSEEVDARSDLWAVGATMFMALTGRQVHEADTTNEELLAAMTQSAAPLGSLAPNLPPELTDLVDTALAFDREKRWPDAGTMQLALQQVLAFLQDEDFVVKFARESFVGCDLTPPVAGHKPVSLSTPRALALTKKFLSFAPEPGKKFGMRGVLVASLVLGTALFAGLRWHRHHIERGPAAAAAAPPVIATAPGPAAPAPIPSEDQARTVMRPEPVVAPEPAASEPSETKPRGRPGSPAKKSRAPAHPIAAPAVEAITPAAPATRSAEPLADPLDRRR